MAIPPFPSNDLAKLVLGYLAEEQLMTAYDEFLQTSPYLDVFRNEFDRIFMTSLKTILAEYRAVKIYVETCKPFLLRKKLIQCSNLLEVVKFLVTHVDINRLQSQELSADKSSYIKQTLYIKRNVCEVCNSLHLSTCECQSKVRQSQMAMRQTTNQNESNSETSIETTSLADLPGSSTAKRNPNRESAEVAHSQSTVVDEPQSCLVQSVAQRSFAQQISQSSQPQQTRQAAMEVEYMDVMNQNQSMTSVRSSSVQHLQNAGVEYNRQDIAQVKSDEAKQKIEEFNTIYSLVCGNNSSVNAPLRSNVVAHSCTNTIISSTGSFQDFTTGVDGNKDKEKPIVPDSSTSENFNTQIKENRTNLTPIANIKGPPVTQYFMRAGTINSPYYTNQSLNCMPKVPSLVRIKEKEDPKVTIISDIKVESYKTNTNNAAKMPQVLRNHSIPMQQMQTIFINGTPAYANKRSSGQSYAFTKDEIMAMPTIIVVPSSGLTHTSSAAYCQSNISSTSTMTTTTNATPRVLGPLVIDVNSPTSKKCTHLPDLGSGDPDELVSKGLVKTFDDTAASLPKDTNPNAPNKTSTPNAVPPIRKSSSTPRRNSHVRVLDFATPRRILHETLNENDPNLQATESNTENVSNGPTDKAVHTNIITNSNYDTPEANNKSKHIKENKKLKKNNWDADLRVLAVGTEVYQETVSTPKPKVKKVKKKKTVSPKTCSVEQVSDTLEADNTKTSHSTSHTTTKSNESLMLVDNVEHSIKEITHNNTQAKASAKNINESEGGTSELHKTNKSHIKVNISDDTPEAERLSLQNVIGARLNISEFLETPYKQALYEIQMETPKFFGPDLPDEPISDIKIMSIPTPRFLSTPRQQSTPSYACRNTDYSSGSSYYKPDDHDYIPTDVLQCTETKTGDTKKRMSKESVPEQIKEKEKSEKPSRPQRKCTRNVSYRNLAKMKDDDSFEAASGSSDNSYKSIKDKKVNKSVDSKARMKSKLKPVSKKNVISYKSPQKPFMKIKPRRPTPVKESLSKGRRKSEIAENGFSNARKRTTIKDKNTIITPIVVAAPTKSRRKSSTPRKLHCTESLSSKTVVQTTCIVSTKQQVQETNACHLQDSDTEQLPLRWSDDGSQDAKPKEKAEQPTSSSLPDEDDITKIKEYIETSAPATLVIDKNNEGSLHIDLIKRGFDVETAKIIERDLLDATPIQDTAIQSTSNEEISVKNIDVTKIVSDKIDSDYIISNNNKHQEEYEVEEIVLSVHECNEDSKNFVTCHFDESKYVPCELSKLKDKFSMELCIDDDLTIRLRPNQFTSLLDMDPEELLTAYSPSETEDAVTSISNFDKLYTPIKDAKAQCYEIFDSTLTSIDTPLKSEAIHETKVTETEIIVEVESIKEDVKEKTEIKKRKRLQSVSLDDTLGKKSKPDAEYLLNSANIQDIDIETVLSKLHGP